jgi:hypothetical protein
MTFIDRRQRCLQCGKVLTRRRHSTISGKFCSMSHSLTFLRERGIAAGDLAQRQPVEGRPQGCETVEAWLLAGGRVYREDDPALRARGING